MPADGRDADIQFQFGRGHPAALYDALEDPQQAEIHVAELPEQRATFGLLCIDAQVNIDIAIFKDWPPDNAQYQHRRRRPAPTDMTDITTAQHDETNLRTDAAWLDAHWMPFTANRQFKADPRMIVSGKGAYYTDAEGRKIFDGLSGCTGLGHGRTEIVEAVSRQVAQLDYAPAFQFGHPKSFELANKIKDRRRPASTTCSSRVRRKRPIPR